MKFTPILVGAFALGLAGCVETASTQDEAFVRVTDATAFSTAVVGRDLLDASGGTNVFKMNADGSLSGNYGRGALAGSWSFEGGFWCRTFTAGLAPDRLNQRDCQLAELRPGQVRLTRDRGNGNAGTFNLR